MLDILGLPSPPGYVVNGSELAGILSASDDPVVSAE